MYKDKVIEEIRERRRLLFKNTFHNSVSELIAASKKFEQEHPEKFALTVPSKKIQKKSA